VYFLHFLEDLLLSQILGQFKDNFVGNFLFYVEINNIVDCSMLFVYGQV